LARLSTRFQMMTPAVVAPPAIAKRPRSRATARRAETRRGNVAREVPGPVAWLD
jgi:hypothetical protein